MPYLFLDCCNWNPVQKGVNYVSMAEGMRGNLQIRPYCVFLDDLLHSAYGDTKKGAFVASWAISGDFKACCDIG